MKKARICIRNGRIWDGERFREGDLAIADGQVAAIGHIDHFHADFTYDAAGKIVSAGLVDIHTHFRGVSIDEFGMQPEMACFPFGVTAAVDAGASQGDGTWLDSLAVKSAVFVFSDIKGDHADFSVAEAMLKRYDKRAIGVKTYYDVHMSDVRTIRPLEETAAFAQKHGLKVMVHCNHSPVPMAQILDVLRPGDILTHIYHGGANSALEDGFTSLMQAKARGVIIDSGHAGHVHTDFRVLRAAMEANVLPSTISTDMTRLSAYVRGGIYGMTMCMSLFRKLGVEEETILRAVTSSAGLAAGRPEWGRLVIGGAADVAVLDYTNGSYSLTDPDGNTFADEHVYQCRLTIADGQVVYRS